MNKLINILLVEDDQLDAIDIKRSLDKLNILYKLTHTRNGEEAIEFLELNSDSLPDLVLLDINMPRVNGLELLSTIRQHIINTAKRRLHIM